MKIDGAGAKLIQGFEGCELEAYPDPASALGKECRKQNRKITDYARVHEWQLFDGEPWTIGWGHTGREVRPGLVWTQLQADTQFYEDISAFERGVELLVQVPLTQNQFNALVSFAYNVGLDIDADTKAEGLGDSTLMRYVNQGKHHMAASEFLKWNKAGGIVLLGLSRRRQAESKMYLTA